MIRRLFFILPVLMFLVLAAYFAVALRPGYDPQALPSAMIGKEAPAFDLPTLNGNGRVSRAGLAGQPIVLNFFASWCMPCRIEHPLLMRLAQERVALYGIDYKDKPDDAKRLLVRIGDPYRAIGVDRDGRIGLDFGVYGVPETYVIDATGRIRKRFVGPLSAEQVDRELLPLLKQLGATAS